MFSLSHGAAWSMAVYSGKPFAGMMNQAPTKANYYYIDCRGSNSLRPFIKFYGATRHGVSNLGFSSSPGAAWSMAVYSGSTVNRESLRDVELGSCGIVELGKTF